MPPQVTPPLAEFRIKADGRLHALCPHADVNDENRSLSDADFELFDSWSAGYQAALKHDQRDRLLALGREMYRWLDGSERWIERMRPVMSPPSLVEFAAPRDVTPPRMRFVEAPWELLADDQDHFALN